jgi:4-hydroxyacetophenone monooxygenase
MAMNSAAAPINDERTLERALQDAELVPLMATLAYVTGDLSLVAPELQPPRRGKNALIAPQGGMPADLQALCRARALTALRRFRDGGSVVADEPTPETLRAIVQYVTGELAEGYEDLALQELGITTADQEGRRWTKPAVAPDVELSVVVVGAGMSGLAAAHKLHEAGIPFTVLERNADVGGVWLENDYPGCRLDTNNFAYSYSFAQKDDWPQQYSRQPDIRGYFHRIATDFDLRPHIRFGVEVTALKFNETDCSWSVSTRGPDGQASELRCQSVISAVGQLNQPSYPSIPGRDHFRGPSFHTARWDHDVDLAGLRVGVVGSGASAYQVIPSIADEVAELRIFQRTPPWALPAPSYHDDIADGLKYLFQHVPQYHRWFRFYQFWIAVEGMRDFAVVDPEWKGAGAVSAANDSLRSVLTDHIRNQYLHRPDLLDKVLPAYPPYGKRMLRDNGVWAQTLHKEHVMLVTDGIEEVTESGIRTTDGVEHELDVIIWGTGFSASNFLASMSVTGRGGADLHETWAGDARAYLGITVPGFPNLFCLYGPNTNLVLNGSIVMFSELAMNYVLECLHLLLTTGHRAMDVQAPVFEAYNQRVDEANQLMAWGAPGVTNWYKNATGRVSQNWPHSTLDYWDMTRRPNASDYEFL